MPDSKVRIGQEVYRELKQLAEASGKSMRELAEEAIRAYVLGKNGVEGKDIKGITNKFIVVQYPTKCYQCGREVRKGELAYWVKITYTDNTTRSYVICLDCYYKGSALKEFYLKKRQIEIVVRELKKEANELADKVNRLRQEVAIYEAIDNVNKAIRDVYDMLEYILDKERRREVQNIIVKLDRIEQQLQEIADSINSIDIALGRKVRRARENVRKKNYY